MTLLRISISVSVMILGVLAVRTIGRQFLSRRVIINLWNLVLLRALFPFQISLEKIPFIAELASQPETAPRTSDILPVASGLMQNVHTKNLIDWLLELTVYFVIIWAVVAVFLAAVETIAYFMKDRVIRNARLTENELTLTLVKAARFRRSVQVYVVPDMDFSPCTTGTFRPKILLPMGFEALTEKEIRHILLHELQHIRSFDVLKRYFMSIAVCIHWFNPLLRVMRDYYIHDQEMACDERVVRKLDGRENTEYATTLCNVIEKKSKKAKVAAGFNKKKFTRERTKAILFYKKMGFCGVLLSVFLVGCSLMAFASYNPENIPKKLVADVAGGTEIPVSPETMGTERAVETEGRTEEVETEVISPVVEDETDKMSEEEYKRVMQDILDNYNDYDEDLTEKQKEAADEFMKKSLAAGLKEQVKNGNVLPAEYMEILKEYYPDY